MKNIFLKWWLIFALISVFSVFCYCLNAFYIIYKNDTSYLCNLIYILFLGGSFWCGYQAWQANKSNSCSLKHNLEIGWFISELCLTIGMIGTVIGFIMMFSGESILKINVENQQSMMNLIGSVANGMSTALYTTLVGLICSSLLKIQYFNLEFNIEKDKK
jgi:hypothetical protein